MEAGVTKVVRTQGPSGGGGYESGEACVAKGLRAPLVPARAFLTQGMLMRRVGLSR